MLVKTERQTVAHGEAYNGDKSVPVSIAIVYPELVSKPVRCAVMPIEAEDLPGEIYLKEGSRYYLQLRGVTNTNTQIWIPRLRITEILQGVAELFVEGDLSDIAEPGANITCNLTLSHMPIVEFILDNERLANHREENLKGGGQTGITWDIGVGTAELGQSDRLYDEMRDIHKVTVHEHECSLVINIDSDKIHSMKDLVNDLWHNQDNVFWLLSFLNKKYVDWYRARIYYLPTKPSQGEMRIIDIRREARLGVADHEWDALDYPEELIVKPEQLKSGVFAYMVKNFENSPYQEAILRAMQAMLATYQRFYFEAHLGLIYTAFEILVDGLGKNDALFFMETEFNDLREEIKKFLKGKLSNVAREKRAEIYRKITELNRPPIEAKATRLLTQYSVELKDFWPPNTEDVSRAFSALLNRRNDYIHGGHIADIFSSNQDLRRLRAICSYWIVTLLGYPAEQINEDEDIGYSKVLRHQVGY
jgi:hypothetical protein